MDKKGLKELRDKCILFNQFMVEKAAIPPQMIEFYKASNELIEEAYQREDSKPLKAASRDIDDQVLRHMPLPMALELKSYFKEKLDLNFDAVDEARIKAISKIVKKGKISSAVEYELLLNRVDEIYSDANSKEEIKQLNELLSKYHKG